MARGTRRQDVKARLTPRRLSWLGWFWGRVWSTARIVLVVAAVIGALVWAFAGGYTNAAGRWIEDKAVAASGAFGLKIRDVLVEGRENLDAEQLRVAMRVAPGDPILGVNINDLHARIAALPWVKAVRVRRAWPDQLIITIDERLPLAIWRTAPGGPAIIDADGVVVTHDGLGSFGRLLAVDGAGADRGASALIELLKGQPEIAVRVKSAARVSDRRWDLTLDSGTVLRLPEDDPGLALARIAKAQAEQKILDQSYKSIDLRQVDRIILESKPGETTDLLSKDGKPV